RHCPEHSPVPPGTRPSLRIRDPLHLPGRDRDDPPHGSPNPAAANNAALRVPPRCRIDFAAAATGGGF
ncbi:hypothetical protein IscW_ISCW002836, partial [Ixodes scapularis]